MWSTYQNAQDKRKRIIKIDEEIAVCDSQIERLSETVKVQIIRRIFFISRPKNSTEFNSNFPF